MKTYAITAMRFDPIENVHRQVGYFETTASSDFEALQKAKNIVGPHGHSFGVFEI